MNIKAVNIVSENNFENAGNINITAEKLGNGGYTTGTSVITTKEGITHGIVFNNQNNIKKDGTIQVEDFTKIPEGDKGLFKVNQDLADIEAKVEGRKEPKFSYLVETNVKFIDKGYYLGSEYFFSRINFNPEKDIRLLGDSFYETTIVNKAIFESTGRRYLNGAATDKEQMQILYDNSVKAMEDFNLSIGVALTKDQINNLKNDIIWYVEEEVNGIPVLVPKVYLSKETLASLDDIKGNQINAGKELNINALAVNNTGSLLGEKGVTITTDNLINESMRNGAYADISGESITIFAKNDIINRGGNIGADKNLILNSENGNILNETKVVINKNTHRDIITDIAGIGNMSGDNVKISVGNSFTNAGGQVQGNKDVNISAGKDINLTSVETVTRKEIGSSRNYTVNEKVQNIESTISGENINLQTGKNLNAIGSDVTAGNNVNVAGSNVVSENNLNLEAGNNVVISSALEGSSQHHESVKTGFLGLSGRQQKDKEIDYTNVKSYVGAGENIDIKADKNVTVLASDVEAGNDVNINATKDVNIIAGDDIRIKESEKHKHKTSLFGGVKDLNFEIGMKTEISKNKNSTLDTKVTGSNISSGGDVNIFSGKDIKIEASNIEGKNTNLKAENELNVTGRDELHVSKIKNEKGEIKITAGVNLGGIKDTVDSVINMVESAKDIPKAGGVIKDLASGKDLNESLEGKEDSINALNTWLNGPADGGVNAGIYAGAEAVKDKSEVKVKDTIESTIISENDVNLKTDKGDMNFTGTDIYAGNDININSGKDINISSGKEKSENKTSSQSVNGQINIVTGQISGGISVSEGESKSEINKNPNFYAENNIDISGKDMTVKGGNIEGEHIKIDVDNLHVESLQDKSSSSDKSINVHGSSDNKNNTSTGAGMTSGKYNKEWVENQTSIIGRENSHITVEGNTHLEGGLLGGKDTTLNTGSLSFNDIKDHEKGTNIGLSENISKGQKDENSNDYTSQLDYSATDREQITHATVGAGTITVGGKEENPEELNRDESKAQEITKDITVNEITIKHQTETRDWNEVKDIMTQHGAEFDNTFKEIYKALGKEYKYDISKDFEEVWSELELIVGKDLKQDLIGLLPTERGEGGLFGQPISEADAKLITQNIKVLEEKEDGTWIIEAVDGEGNAKHGIFGNGMLNFGDTFQISATNQEVPPELKEVLSRGETVTITTYYDPSHGVIADTAEAMVDIIGYYTGGKIMSPNAKKLANEIRKNPDLISHYVAHSKGSTLIANAILDIINSGEAEILKGKAIRVNGSPINTEKMKELGEKYDFKFITATNEFDFTNIISGNEVNTNSYWHTSTSNDPNKGYNSNQIQNDVTGEFVVEENDNFHKTNEVEKINGKNTTSKISQKIKEFFKKSKKEGEK